MLPIHLSKDSEQPSLKWFLWGTAGASVVFACVWGALTRDWAQTLFAAALPWAFVVACFLISLSWTLLMIPLLSLVARWFGGNNEQK